MAMVSPRVISENTRASRLTSRRRAARSASLPGADTPGVTPITSAPANGTAPITVSQGNVLMSRGLLDSRQQEGVEQEPPAEEHGKGVGGEESALDPAQPARRAADDRGHRVDQAVHT